MLGSSRGDPLRGGRRGNLRPRGNLHGVAQTQYHVARHVPRHLRLDHCSTTPGLCCPPWEALTICSTCCSGTLSERLVTCPAAVTLRFCNNAALDAARPFGALICTMLANILSVSASAVASLSVRETACAVSTTLTPNFTPPLACCTLFSVAAAASNCAGGTRVTNQASSVVLSWFT